MKILHFVAHSFPLVDGYSIRTKYILQVQQQLGYQPIVVTRPGFADEYEKTLSYCEEIEDVVHFHFTEKDYPIINFAKKLPRGRGYIRRRLAPRYYCQVVNQCAPCDFFHVHMHPEQLKYLLPLARQCKVPLIYEVRGVWEDSAVACNRLRSDSKEYQRMKHVATQAATSADWVITISEGLRQDFMSRGISGEKIMVMPNGVDTLFFKPLARDPRREETLGLVGKTVLGYISSLRELEGIEYLILAMPGILEAAPDTVCLIVGDGDDRPRLESLVKKLGLKNKVIFTGKVPHDDIRAYYSLIDVFVVPRPDRRVNNLVTPLKPLEAMAMEKPLVVSRVGGLTEMVQDGKTGLVFAPESSHDLAKKALVLVRSAELRIKLGKQARSFVVRERDWRDVVKNYQEVYSGSFA